MLPQNKPQVVVSNKKLFSAYARGIRKDGGLQRGFHWTESRRGLLAVYEDRLELGSWKIPCDSVQSVILYKIKGFFGGYLLEVHTSDGPYSFGLMSSTFWKSDLPFPAERREGLLSGNTTSKFYRLGLLCAWLGLMYYLFFMKS